MDAIDGGLTAIVAVKADPFPDLDILAVETYAGIRVVDECHWPLADDKADLALILHLFQGVVGTIEAGAIGQNCERGQPMRGYEHPVVRDLAIAHRLLAFLEQEDFRVARV